jgi:hypothetical protein
MERASSARHTASMRWRRGAAVLLTSAGFALACVSAAAAATPGPLSVVRQYVRALAAHDARRVCHTFSPALVAFDSRWETGKTCVRRVANEHFSAYSPGHDVRRVEIVRVAAIRTDAYGTVGVHVVLWYRFPCQGTVSVIPGCRPHFERIPDVIYLRFEHGRWLIVKPGVIYENTSMTAPPWIDALSPPGDRESVGRPAVIAPPPLLCPPGGREVINRHQDLHSSMGWRPQLVPATRVPWLHIRTARFVWLARHQLCVTMTLAAPPLADSIYAVDVGQPQGGGELQDSYDIDINGIGGVSVRLHDTLDSYRRPASLCPTGFGLSGVQLTLVISPPDGAFHLNAATHVGVSTLSLQPGEPLLLHPIDAEDDTPGLAGLTLAPPDARRLPRCAALNAG